MIFHTTCGWTRLFFSRNVSNLCNREGHGRQFEPCEFLGSPRRDVGTVGAERNRRSVFTTTGCHWM
jgi:hypothetical protein